MKFQTRALNFFLNGRTDGRTSRKQYAPHFFKVGGIKSGNTVFSEMSFQRVITLEKQNDFFFLKIFNGQ